MPRRGLRPDGTETCIAMPRMWQAVCSERFVAQTMDLRQLLVVRALLEMREESRGDSMTDTAIALLTTGSRIPLSDPLDEARRLFRDQQYDSDVIGIELDSGEPGHANPVMETTRTQARMEGL